MFVRVLGSPRTLFVCGRNTVSCKLLRSVGDGTAAKIRGLDHSWGGLREGRGLCRMFSADKGAPDHIQRRVEEATSALPIDRQHQELIKSRLEELEANKPDLDKFALFNPESLAELPFFLDFL